MSIAAVAAAAAVLTWVAIHIERRVVRRPGVFINYRREECAGQAGRLSNGLLAGLGREHVFIDIEAIRPGADFGARIEDAIGSCNVMLALIGHHWLEIKNAEGKRRLDDPEDYVRREIEAGLAATQMTVIPVLVEGAPMPAAAQLPATLAPLAVRNAFELSNRHWAHDEKRLIQVLQRDLGILSTPLVAGLTSLIMAMLLALTLLAVSGDTSGTAATMRVLRSDDLTVTLPQGWKQRAVPAVPGFDPATARAAANGGDGFVTAQFVEGNANSTLLPQELLDALEDRTPARERVRVAGGEAYRYEDPAPRGVSQRLTVYAMLATGGVALVACGTSRRAPFDGCRRVADSLQLRAARLLPIAPSNQYRVAVARTFAALARQLREHDDAFRHAGSAAARATVADRLARDYGAALAPLRRGVVNPLDGGLNANVTTAFRQTSSAFMRASQAYSSADAKALADVQTTLSRVWARLRTATTAVERAAHSTIDLPRPPRLPRQTGRPVQSVPPPPPLTRSPIVPPPVPPPSARPPAPPPAPAANPGGGDG